MTQEIIEMANEVNLCQSIWIDSPDENLASVVRFAKLVAEKERNRLADELQKMPLNDTANSIAIWIRGKE